MARSRRRIVSVQPDQIAPYVFLSYASADRARALEIADRFEAAGIRVWIDRQSIEGGASWSEQIVQGIRACAALVLLATPRSVTSRNVLERTRALLAGL